MTVNERLALALQLHRSSRADEAEAACRQVLQEQPKHPDALHLLGMIFQQSGQHEEAVRLIEQAIAAYPVSAQYYFNLGISLANLGRMLKAAEAFDRSTQLDPDRAATFANLGNALRRIGKPGEAAAAFRRAMELQAGYVDAMMGYSNALLDLRRRDEAIAVLREAAALDPDSGAIRNNLGLALAGQDDIDGAIAEYETGIRIQPELAELHSNLGEALRMKGRFDDAMAACRQAIALRPDFADGHCNLSQLLGAVGRVERSIAACRRASELRPHSSSLASNLLFNLQFSREYGWEAILEAHKDWGRRFGEPLRETIRPHENERSASRRLRIGYVSPYFCLHVLALMESPLFGSHDRDQVEVFCYSGAERPDAVTEEIKAKADVWRAVARMKDEELAELVRKDRIDIVVDLAMHMGGSRLLMMARKPAPVQVTWLAYPGTTGLGTMDYRLTDPYLDPPGQHDERYTERSIRLRDTFWCYDPHGMGDRTLPDVNSLPAERNGHITFGSLNHLRKMNGQVAALWSRVMHRTPGSRLLMLAPEGEARRSVLDMLREEGIEPDRVDFVARQERAAYMGVFGRIDICLDTVPYNGHTTSLDSMWMGVPVVTRIGPTLVGRAGFSQLSNLGLTELAAESDDRFVEIATGLAGDVLRLRELRRTLRPRMESSPLMDSGRFARSMESAFRRMWEDWLEGRG
jgi:predicted O-linked N-acetylglucosamine transferase (SPINDLY family)